MRGWIAVAGMLGATVAALVLPWAALVALAVVAWATMPRRWGFLAFAAVTISFNAVLLAWLHPAAPDAHVGPIGLSETGFLAGAVGGTRIVALMAANLAIVSRYAPARLLEDLRLPRRAQGFLAAILIAAHDVGRDFARLRDARRLEGAAADGRMDRVRAAAALVPALMVAAADRAQRRRDALRLAGLDTGPHFAPIVAVTALAVAGRLALVAVPNVSLTFAIVFAGGVAFGARVGWWAGIWSMFLTDLILSGLFLPAFVNVPTTALLGASGGAFSRQWRRPGATGLGTRMFAAAIGILGTLAWSIATDALSWAVIAENRASVDRLRFAVVAGLVFNAVPALVNGFLFAAIVSPVGAAFAGFRRSDGRQTA